MTENEIAKIVVDTSYHIHKKLGPGLLETVYEVILYHELQKRGLTVERQVPISFRWDNITFQEGFRADLIVEDKLILELKSVAELAKLHKKQLLTFLRLADKRLGLLINFGGERIKGNIERVANGLEE